MRGLAKSYLSSNDKCFARRRIGNPAGPYRDSYRSFHFLVVPVSRLHSLSQLQERAGIALLAISWCPEHARGADQADDSLGGATHLTARIPTTGCFVAGCFVFGSRACNAHLTSRLPTRAIYSLPRLVRQKAIARGRYTGKCCPILHPSHLVAYHGAIKMELYLHRAPRHTSINYK